MHLLTTMPDLVFRSNFYNLEREVVAYFSLLFEGLLFYSPPPIIFSTDESAVILPLLQD